MKTKRIISKQAMVLSAVVATTAAINVSADQPMPAGPEKTYTGRITDVDPQDRTLSVKAWALSQKQFDLGANCNYALVGIKNGTAGDLRPGQEVTVTYVDSQGVRIVDRVMQQPLQMDGMVTSIDPNTHMLTIRDDGMNRTMQITDGCNVTLRESKAGVLSDIQPGDHVTVTYETPYGKRMARDIEQTSVIFTGKLTAIDLDQKIIQARGDYGAKQFNVANNCAIMINGRTDGKLNELLPDEELQFDYDTINGVNVVNRIAPAPAKPRSTAFSSTSTYPGYPTGF